MLMVYGISQFPEGKIESIAVSKTGMKINRYQRTAHIIIKAYFGHESLCYAIGFYAYRYQVAALLVEEKGKG